MRIFLCGGGCGQQTVDANKKLNEVIDHNKPILYIPLAMPSERYPSCYEWIKDELKGVDVPNIDMVVSGADLFNKNLENYSALFIGGGNTFKLLKDLKDSGSSEKIKIFIFKLLCFFTLQTLQTPIGKQKNPKVISPPGLFCNIEQKANAAQCAPLRVRHNLLLRQKIT